MPIDKTKYPPDWPQISQQVRSAVGWVCEWCGAPNKAVIIRDNPRDGAAWRLVKEVYNPGLILVGGRVGGMEPTANFTWAQLQQHGLTRVILTVAHLDRNPSNNDRRNLAALCQRCHLIHDILQHLANRKYGREHGGDQQLKLEL